MLALGDTGHLALGWRLARLLGVLRGVYHCLVGGRITGEGDSTAEVRGSNTLVVGRIAGVRGSNTLVVGSMAVVRGSKTLVGGSTASAFDDTFWSGCALQGEKHTSEEVWRLRNSRPWRSYCLLQTCPISPSARWLHRFKVCVYAMRCVSINCICIF